jgi:mannose-6-phosphate isomerase-like protein (cupin superfamily)
MGTKLIWLSITVLVVFSSLFLIAQTPARPTKDPATAVFWNAARMKEIDQQLASRQDPTTHNAGTALIASANAIYRTGPSQSEIHEKQGDLIFIREGEGTIVVGGKMIGGKPERPNEIRGDSIEGGTRYAVAAGDSIYIPANMPHQFFVENGKHWAITIVKLNPQP